MSEVINNQHPLAKVFGYPITNFAETAETDFVLFTTECRTAQKIRQAILLEFAVFTMKIVP
jgi:hypothetical protein